MEAVRGHKNSTGYAVFVYGEPPTSKKRVKPSRVASRFLPSNHWLGSICLKTPIIACSFGRTSIGTLSSGADLRRFTRQITLCSQSLSNFCPIFQFSHIVHSPKGHKALGVIVVIRLGAMKGINPRTVVVISPPPQSASRDFLCLQILLKTPTGQVHCILVTK
jgi:hypothetical protein